VALTARSCKAQIANNGSEEAVNEGSPEIEMSLTAAAVVTGSIEIVSTNGRLQAALDALTCALPSA
jgi:hypothetical protein